MFKIFKMMLKSEKGINIFYLLNEYFFKNSITSFKKYYYYFKFYVCMYVMLF